MGGLFRPEVLEERSRHGLGTVQITRPASFGVLTALVLATMLCVAGFLLVGEYTRKARVSGHLVPDRGVIRLVSPQAATVLESHVSEGRKVRQGDVLFVLGLDQGTLVDERLEAVRRSLATRERSLQGASVQHDQIERQRLAALDRQIDQMRREDAQLRAELALHRQRLALADEAMLRIDSLRQQNFVSAAQVQAKSEDALAVRAQLMSLERQLTVREREIDQLLAQRRELPMQSRAHRGEIERDLALLAQQAAETEADRRIVLRAPQDGVVTAAQVAQGQSVGPASALASLLPADARLQAHLYAPSSAIGFIRQDQPVLLRYGAFPYQKFGHQSGRVIDVSRTPLPAGEPGMAGVPDAGDASTEPMYRITVMLQRQTVEAYGQPQPLVPGMRLDADVQLDRRRLIEWIFEPLLGVAGRV